MDDDQTTSSVTANGDINYTKIIIKNGDSIDTKPREGCWCTIICKNLSNYSYFKLSQIGIAFDQPFKLRIGYFNTEICRYLHTAIETMNLNEISEISFELNQRLVIPNENPIKTIVFLDLKFQIELIDIDFESFQSKLYNMSCEQLIDLAIQHKNDANEIFKQGLVFTAFFRYQKAIRYLIIGQQLLKSSDKNENTIKEEKEEEVLNYESNIDKQSHEIHKKKLFELKALLYLNMAACQLKYPSNANHVIVNCTKCLEIDSNNVKALYRRSMALCEIYEYNKAIDDLKNALKLEPNNKAVNEQLKYVEDVRRKKNIEIAANLRKMFN